MSRLRALTTCALATVALLATAPAASADDLPNAAECNFSITGLSNSDDALFVAVGHAYVTSDAVLGVHLACDYYLPNDEVHIAGSSVGPAVAAAGTQVTGIGFVITCTTLTITWFDGDSTTTTHCDGIPG